jgi:serine/threonine-protein kinase
MQGMILAGRYRLLHQLGKGGMGSVWAAEHLALHSSVAVKLLDDQIAGNPDAVERFQREAQAAATLRSAHVVQVLDYGVDGTTPFLVMELLKGEDLASRLQRMGRIEPAPLVEIFQQVARAVGRAHAAGIVHRDLKPENVFLVDEGDHEIVKVLDFGIAKSVALGFAPSATRTGVTMGTPYYMSPEQAEGKREVDHRTDLWALGVIASECLTGVRPFDGQTFGELLLNICARPAPVPSSVGAVPRHFDTWFAKATHRDPACRFATVNELVSTFADVVRGKAPAGMDAIPLTTAPLDEPAPVAPARTPQRTPAATHANSSVTVDPEDAPKIPTQSYGWLLVAALVGVGLVGAGGYWLFARTASAEGDVAHAAASGSAQGAASGSAIQAAALPAVAPVVDAPSAVFTPAASASNIVPTPAQHTPHAAAPQTPSEREAKPTPKPESATPTAASARTTPTPKTQSCVSDPFTGALRKAVRGEASTVPCKQNPFTGGYQRL